MPTDTGKHRCWWPGNDAEYQRYHDVEWGRAVTDSTALFEKMCLEGFQSGLSWLTILRKRENFREAFFNFDHHRIALCSERDIQKLLTDAGIVRHRGKIEAVINNAQRLIDLENDGHTLSEYVWSYALHAPFGKDHAEKLDEPLASVSMQSAALSKDLKKRGWKFVGPTTMYSFMQSMGLVNDHLEGCFVRDECEQLRQRTIQRLFPEAK